MRTLLFVLSVLSAAPARETVVQAGESLADVARRTLGSPEAASELQAINHLASDRVSPGTELLLPGPERARAVSAIASARSAVRQARVGAARTEATERLADAERMLGQAHYAEAAAQADGAWKLVSQRAEDPSHFAVQVAEDGTTRVRVDSGVPVRVEAEGRTRAVSPGETVLVRRGEAPGVPTSELAPLGSPALEAPVLLSPAADRLALDPKGKGVGPLKLSWRPVAGANGYLVELKGTSTQTLRTTRADTTFAVLPTGTYRWSVRAIGAEGKLGPPSERALDLSSSTIKLDVQEPNWK